LEIKASEVVTVYVNRQGQPAMLVDVASSYALIHDWLIEKKSK
jgi:hypothetical protein